MHYSLCGYGVSFWKGNVACGQEGATRAVVYTGAPGVPFPEVEFRLPEQRHEMEKLEQMLMKAFEAGRWCAKKEIRDALGIGS